MQFFKHPHCNHSFKAPPGTESECDELHVLTHRDPTFGVGHASFWRPSAEQLAELVAGGSIVLCIYGHGHPVVSMNTASKESENV